MKGFNPLTVSKAAKKYEIEEKEISDPNENTFKNLDDSRTKNVNDLTKQIKEGALTQEEGLIKIQETNKEHNILEAQAELNNAKASIKAEEKSGINPTDTDIRVLANKLQSGESLNAKDNSTLIVTDSVSKYYALNIETGEILWTIKKVFTSILITDQYVFSLKGSMLEALSLKTGKEHFILSLIHI